MRRSVIAVDAALHEKKEKARRVRAFLSGIASSATLMERLYDVGDALSQ
jgi:dihydroorotase-like cyclic amidohydrolase